ncbi:MAG: alpha/beta hydrolase-fold protein [Candidatus Dormibacteraeota bacterium]|nr:alpha/beta hydrolase-fold protein [Candidatus Dormibacteraeota bacterium]
MGASAAAFLAACSVSPIVTPGPIVPPVQERQLMVDGQARTYRLYTPASVAALDSVPLVVVLHAAGQTGSDIASTTGFDQAADGNRFMVVYPDGLRKNWNAGFCCESPSRVNDTLFLSRLLDELEADKHIDRGRVYVAGISAGAFMAYRLACDMANRITAIGSVAGSVLPATCHPSRPVSLIEIHGTADKSVPYAGGQVEPVGAASAPVPSTLAVVGQWAAEDGCAQAPTVENAAPVLTTLWTGCAAGSRVVLDTVQGGHHTWYATGLGVADGSIDATTAIWKFFSGQALHP